MRLRWPLSPFEPLRPSRLLDTLLPGHRSQNVTLAEAALFALSSVLFVAASTAPFYGLRRVQNAFMTVATTVPGLRARGDFRRRPHNKRRLPVGRDIIPGAMLPSTWERRLASPLSASFSRTACATSEGNISNNDLLNCHYRRSDRRSSCVLFATTRYASVAQAGTCFPPCSISAGCRPRLMN